MHARTDMQEYAGTHRDRYKHFGIALAEAFVFLFLLYFAYISICISTYFSFLCCASRTEFRNFKWKSCLSTFLTATSTCDATATATTTAESASVLLLAAKLRKLLHCFKSYLECLVYLRAPQLNASIKTSFQHAENAILILIWFQVDF